MKAVIVGAGEVGYHLADRLSKEGHDITLVETNLDHVTYLQDRLNCNVIQGHGSSAAVLEDAGIQSAELFIAVTNVDEVNMMACILASEYGVPRKIARVNSSEFLSSGGMLNAEKLGIQLLINPPSVVGEEIAKMVSYSDTVEVAEFADGQVLFLGYGISKDNPFVGMSLKDLGWTQESARIVVTSIVRQDKTIVPTGDDVIQEGDTVYLVTKRNSVPHIRSVFGYESRRDKNIFILGAGHVGYEVARRLADGEHRVKVIDRDETHCKEMAESLEGVLVLNTTSTDVETLKSEGISRGDVFIAVTDDDQSNILGSLLAKRMGIKRAICLVNQQELKGLASSLGIEVTISPRLSTASAILKYIRGGNVLSMIEQSDAEVLEIQLPSEAKFLNKPIHSIGIPTGVIIGAIVRGNHALIPGGGDELKSGDRVILFTLLNSVSKVEKFFS